MFCCHAHNMHYACEGFLPRISYREAKWVMVLSKTQFAGNPENVWNELFHLVFQLTFHDFYFPLKSPLLVLQAFNSLILKDFIYSFL